MRLSLALTLSLLSGCYLSHGRDDDAGRRDAPSADVPGSCLPPGRYPVTLRFTDVSPPGCRDTSGGTIEMSVPPREADLAGMCGSAGVTEITELGPCTWRVFSECAIPDASTRLEGTISTASGAVAGRFDVELSGLAGPCTATLLVDGL